MRPTGVFICIPAVRGSITTETASTLYSVGQWLTAEGIPNQCILWSAADIAEVRNLMLSMWYDTKPHCDHMLFIDDDMGFHPQLIRDMLKFGKPITGALYARREMQPYVVGAVPDGLAFKDIVKGHLKVTAVGAGVLLIKRAAIDEMLKQTPELIDPNSWMLNKVGGTFGLERIIRAFDPIVGVGSDGKTLRLSEDLSFCRRWHDCGGEIWANVNHKISHIGSFDYHLRYAGVLERQAKQELVPGDFIADAAIAAAEAA